MAGSFRPMKLRLPGLSALLECQNSRCSLPGELDCGQLADDHVVVPRAQAVDVLRDVDPAQLHVDAKFREVALERQDDPFHVGLGQHELEAQRLAVRADHLVVLDPVAGLQQQLVGLAPLLADHAAAVVDRRLVDLVEDLRRGSLPRSGSRIFSSASSGNWWAAISEFSK